MRSVTYSMAGALLAFVVTLCGGVMMAGPANAFLLGLNKPDLCTNNAPNGTDAISCLWSFDTIASMKFSGAPIVTEGSANIGRLGRIGFATSDLTIDQVGEDHTNSEASMLPWDRQLGIARDLSARIGIKIDVTQLRSEEFLLLPAAFNPAFLSDFVNYFACAAAHTFIFSGALDGRSDAPHVTERSNASKESVCLNIAGADCRQTTAKFEPRRRYFNSQVQCRYRPKLIYPPIHNQTPGRSIGHSRAP